MNNPFEISKKRKRGGAASTIATKPFFNRNPDMPEVKCRNFGKASHEGWCDEVARVGFATCDGCVERLKSA